MLCNDWKAKTKRGFLKFKKVAIMHTYKDKETKKAAQKARKERKEQREAKRNWN